VPGQGPFLFLPVVTGTDRVRPLKPLVLLPRSLGLQELGMGFVERRNSDAGHSPAWPTPTGASGRSSAAPGWMPGASRPVGASLVQPEVVHVSFGPACSWGVGLPS
jgi:hypothetical protein